MQLASIEYIVGEWRVYDTRTCGGGNKISTVLISSLSKVQFLELRV